MKSLLFLAPPDLGPETAHSQTACVLAQGQRPALRSEPCGFEAMALDLQTSRPILEVPGAGDATSCQCSLQKVLRPWMQQRGPVSRVFDCKSARNVVPLEEGNRCWGGRPGRRRPPRVGACAPWRESAACSSGQPADCAPTSKAPGPSPVPRLCAWCSQLQSWALRRWATPAPA